MKTVFSFPQLIIAALMSFFFAYPTHAERLIDDEHLTCGYEETENGTQPVKCNIATQKCIMCKERKLKVAPITGIVYKQVAQVYKCVSLDASYPKRCKLAANGGLTGDSWKSDPLGLFKFRRVEGQHCVAENFVIKYSNCYGCAVVQTLTSAFIKAGGQAYETSRHAANIIITIAMSLWLAFFALKNVSSFATVEPMKMLQEFFTQCFKVILALVILNSGIQTILNYTLVPILSVGTDAADSITANLSIRQDGLSDADLGDADD